MQNIKIETISILPFGMVNAFLLLKEGSAILMDTGLPNSVPKVERVLKKNGLSWKNLKLICLTHAHIDHAGSATDIRAVSGAPILAHKDELPYCAGEPPKVFPTGGFGKLFRKTGAIEQKFQYFQPDIVMSDEEMSLDEFGFSVHLVHTPGHTPGSLSACLSSGDVIAGDLAASGILLGGIILKNKPKQPPFEESARAVARSLQNLLDRGSSRFFLGHGGPLNSAQIKTHIQYLSEKYLAVQSL
jgi:glyoxylase-like metal-dependent hydrolase (beta-lactamase superfamily II)